MAPDTPLPIILLFARNSWVLLLRGILAVCFSILAFSFARLTLATLVLLFGAYALIDGAFSLFAALTGWQHGEYRWLLLLEGLIGLGAGFATLRSPGITAVVLIYFIAAWALATGVLRIVQAIRLHRGILGEFWLALSGGVVSVAFAFLVMLLPPAGALTMIWFIGWYALLMGTMLVALSFKLRGTSRSDRASASAGSVRA